MSCETYMPQDQSARCVPKKLNYARSSNLSLKLYIETIALKVFGQAAFTIEAQTSHSFASFLEDICDLSTVGKGEFTRRVHMIYRLFCENKNPVKTKGLAANLYWRYINYCNKNKNE